MKLRGLVVCHRQHNKVYVNKDPQLSSDETSPLVLTNHNCMYLNQSHTLLVLSVYSQLHVLTLNCMPSMTPFIKFDAGKINWIW